MRLPYIDLNSPNTFTTPQETAIVDRIRTRRAPRPLQPLDLTLLHSPEVADGWNSFIGAIRTKTSLPDDVREIAICRIAVLNEAWYEWMHHAPLAEKGGVGKKGMELLEVREPRDDGEEALSRKQWAVVRYADTMTRDVRVEEGVFDELREHFSEKEIVELTSTVSLFYP